MSDKHEWDVDINPTAGEAILDINMGASTFLTGPFDAGEEACDLGIIHVNNTGQVGNGEYQVFRYPGAGGGMEQQMSSGQWTDIPVGNDVALGQMYGQIPDPFYDLTMPVGVRVRGITEDWPPWGGLGTMIFSGKIQLQDYILPVAALIGGAAVLYLIFKK